MRLPESDHEADEGNQAMNSRSRRHGEAKSQAEVQEARIGSQVRRNLPVLLGAVAIVGAGLWFAGLLPPGGGAERPEAAPASVSQSTSNQSTSNGTTSGQLPRFVTAAGSRAQAAYEFAAGHGAELEYIPCYCGCGDHSGHRNVRDCFIKTQTLTSITYDNHGADCYVCVEIVLDVKAQLGEGQPLAAVRSYIDGKYSKVGPGTDTPLPPGMEE